MTRLLAPQEGFEFIKCENYDDDVVAEMVL